MNILAVDPAFFYMLKEGKRLELGMFVELIKGIIVLVWRKQDTTGIKPW